MRVFSQINNCQQKQNKKQNKKQKQKTYKTKRGAPLLGLAKSIYYECIFNVSYYGCLYRSTNDLTRLANRGQLSKKRNFKMAGYFRRCVQIKKVAHRRGKFGDSAILTSETKNGGDFRV